MEERKEETIDDLKKARERRHKHNLCAYHSSAIEDLLEDLRQFKANQYYCGVVFEDSFLLDQDLFVQITQIEHVIEHHLKQIKAKYSKQRIESVFGGMKKNKQDD